MKPAPFTYHKPATIEDAVKLMATLENAKALAGGQSLIAMMNFRFVVPDHLVDLAGIASLSGINLDGGLLKIGAMTTQREIEFSPIIAEAAPLFREALALVGHRQTRNRGTIGGSLAHADPAAELPAILAAYDAQLKIVGPSGPRTVPMSDFNRGFMATAIGHDELLVEIEIAPWSKGHGSAFKEFARRHGDFAVVGVAALVELAANGTISKCALAVCGASTAPQRLPAAEQAITGNQPTPDAIAAAARTAGTIDAIEDIHASPDYRRHLAHMLTGRALTAAIAKVGSAPNNGTS